MSIQQTRSLGLLSQSVLLAVDALDVRADQGGGFARWSAATRPGAPRIASPAASPSSRATPRVPAASSTNPLSLEEYRHRQESDALVAVLNGRVPSEAVAIGGGQPRAGPASRHRRQGASVVPARIQPVLVAQPCMPPVRALDPAGHGLPPRALDQRGLDPPALRYFASREARLWYAAAHLRRHSERLFGLRDGVSRIPRSVSTAHAVARLRWSLSATSLGRVALIDPPVLPEDPSGHGILRLAIGECQECSHEAEPHNMSIQQTRLFAWRLSHNRSWTQLMLWTLGRPYGGALEGAAVCESRRQVGGLVGVDPASSDFAVRVPQT